MAARDIRFTPTYQFWAAIVLATGFGIAVGLLVNHGWDLGLLARVAINAAVSTGIVLFFLRRRQPRVPLSVTGYEHPILGLYAGVATLITTLLLGSSVERAVVGAVLTGAVVATAFVLARRWTVRHRPLGPGTTPTVTGWR